MQIKEIQSLARIASSLSQGVSTLDGNTLAVERGWIDHNNDITAEGQSVLLALSDVDSTRTVFRNF